MPRKPKKNPVSLITKTPLDPEEKALLQRCLETPWDDAPILVYADWVQDNNEDERAAFIRDGVREGKMQSSWPKSVAKWVKKTLPRSSWQIFRGIPVRVIEFDCERLAGHWPPGNAAEEREMMWADRKTVRDINRVLRAEADDGWPLGLSVIQQRSDCMPFCDDCIESLVKLPVMTRVGVLRIEVNEMSGNSAEFLANSKRLKNLWWLRWPEPSEQETSILTNGLKRLRVLDGEVDEDEDERESWIRSYRT